MKFPFLASAIVVFSMLCGCLWAGEYTKDWQAFEKEVERSYPFFKEKGIADDWRKVKPEWRKRADACTDDVAFLKLVDEAICLMRDGHAGIVKTRVSLRDALPSRKFGLPAAFRPAKGGKVVVASAAGPMRRVLTPGTVVLKIDGADARKQLDRRAKDAWEAGGYFSSPQRATFLEYRKPLQAEEPSEHTLTCEIDGVRRDIVLKNDCANTLPVYQFPPGMTPTAGSCAYALLPGGAGYLYMRRIQGDDTARGIEEAMEKHPGVPGWVVDLRGNGGGGYSDELNKVLKKLVAKKTAVIIDAGCFSAGETFARDLKIAGGSKTILLGAVTAGSSSSKKEWDFPSGVASIRFSVASRKGLKGKLIEFYGIAPDIAVESDPEDLKKGLDTEIVEAEKYVLGSRSQMLRQ